MVDVLKVDLFKLNGTVTLDDNTVSLTDATLTKVGGLNDANDNEVIEIAATSSAVNYVKLANAASDGNPTVSAVGDDTNVGLTVALKGTGNFVMALPTSDPEVEDAWWNNSGVVTVSAG